MCMKTLKHVLFCLFSTHLMFFIIDKDESTRNMFIPNS